MNCYLLVGGRSSRMGQSKTALFAGRVIAAARPAFDEVIAVQRHGGEEIAQVRTIHEDEHLDEAAVFGVARALRDLGGAGKCVILAVDYPRITTDLLRFLRERFEASRAAMLVPVWNGHPQTLCAGYDASLLPLVEKRLADRRYDLRGLIAEAAAEMIGERLLRERFSGEPLVNVNTPEELEQAEALDG
ncbi:MAG TPA: molybdenum cofactor guanylyltransferase [Thermoanaerobaculia bacterium]|jgi:molybdopterin-guanine dinucleotide biosynthesis protein A